MNRSLLLLSSFLLFILCSCGKEESPLVRKWQAVSIDDALMNRLLQDQETFIDSMGKNTDADQNMKLYYTTNIDSLRSNLRDSLNAYKAKQMERPGHIWYQFRQDSVVIMHSRSGLDSAAWYFEGDNLLVLDRQKIKHEGPVVRLEILSLNDTVLKVKNAVGPNPVVTTFHPALK